ncbi:MAG: hypothetical protein M3Y41_13500, partial [Pseudomonadota bacterium]|nr:hypothetical protein [Pseudomonadota bacterium]
VTVTLDKQLVTSTGVTTEAIDIGLNNAQVFGTTVSGDLVIGQSHADLPGAVQSGGMVPGTMADGSVASSGMTLNDLPAAIGTLGTSASTTSNGLKPEAATGKGTVMPTMPTDTSRVISLPHTAG